eukprot:223202-Chlamydomonas_euryale.AAC.2
MHRHRHRHARLHALLHSQLACLPPTPCHPGRRSAGPPGPYRCVVAVPDGSHAADRVWHASDRGGGDWPLVQCARRGVHAPGAAAPGGLHASVSRPPAVPVAAVAVGAMGTAVGWQLRASAVVPAGAAPRRRAAQLAGTNRRGRAAVGGHSWRERRRPGGRRASARRRVQPGVAAQALQRQSRLCKPQREGACAAWVVCVHACAAWVVRVHACAAW